MKIKQYSSFNENNTPNIEFDYSTITNAYFTIAFKNQKEKFNIDNSYYIELPIKKDQNQSQNISIRLIKDDIIDEDYIQLETIKIEKGTGEYIVKISFKPSLLDFNGIAFVSNNSNKIEHGNKDISAYILNNIISENNYISQLSVQGDIGFRFVINGEKIEIGRTGIYELPIENYKVEFLGVIDNDKTFIINYREEEII